LNLPELCQYIEFNLLNADTSKIAGILDFKNVNNFSQNRTIGQSSDVVTAFIVSVQMVVLKNDINALVQGKRKGAHQRIFHLKLFSRTNQNV
jgi:hypothetical protein